MYLEEVDELCRHADVGDERRMLFTELEQHYVAVLEYTAKLNLLTGEPMPSTQPFSHSGG